MTSNVGAVLDTNVAISAALLPQSTPRRAFDLVLGHGTSLISIATLPLLFFNPLLIQPKAVLMACHNLPYNLARLPSQRFYGTVVSTRCEE